MRKTKVRRCKICGAKMSPYRIRICEACQEAGMGREIRGSIDAEELLEVAKAREHFGTYILDEMSIDEIAAIARLWNAPYCTYGRFRSYVDTMRKLPPKEYLR